MPKWLPHSHCLFKQSLSQIHGRVSRMGMFVPPHSQLTLTEQTRPLLLLFLLSSRALGGTCGREGHSYRQSSIVNHSKTTLRCSFSPIMDSQGLPSHPLPRELCVPCLSERHHGLHAMWERAAPNLPPQVACLSSHLTDLLSSIYRQDKRKVVLCRWCGGASQHATSLSSSHPFIGGN